MKKIEELINNTIQMKKSLDFQKKMASKIMSILSDETSNKNWTEGHRLAEAGHSIIYVFIDFIQLTQLSINLDDETKTLITSALIASMEYNLKDLKGKLKFYDPDQEQIIFDEKNLN